MDRDAMVHLLGKALASDVSLFEDDWTHLVLVCVIDAGRIGMTGFCYVDGGRAMPVTPGKVEIFSALMQLRTAMDEADGKDRPWVSALFRLEGATGSFVAEFEYDDAQRWAVTPQNVQQRAAEWAPR